MKKKHSWLKRSSYVTQGADFRKENWGGCLIWLIKKHWALKCLYTSCCFFPEFPKHQDPDLQDLHIELPLFSEKMPVNTHILFVHNGGFDISGLETEVLLRLSPLWL